MKVFIIIMALMVPQLAMSDNIWDRKKPPQDSEKWNQVSSSGGQTWPLSENLWQGFFPRHGNSATAKEPVMQIASGNIWTGGCKLLGFDRFILFLRGSMYGNNLA